MGKLKKMLVSFLALILISAIGCSSSSGTVLIEDGSTVIKNTVSVLMNEWEVTVDPNYKIGKHIKPGQLTLTLSNEGSLEHNLILLNNNKHEELALTADRTMVDESKLDILSRMGTIQPGETGQLVVQDLQAGVYAFICNTPGHYELGMVHKIIAR
jgi:uncharacterized cupredoxin-like copper-binding protein